MDSHENAPGPPPHASVRSACVRRWESRLLSTEECGARRPSAHTTRSAAAGHRGAGGDFSDLVATAIANAAPAPNSLRPGPGSSLPPTTRGAASNATCTTALNSGWSVWGSVAAGRGSGAARPAAAQGAARSHRDRLTGISADLQEISRGIHPAILSKGGLGPRSRRWPDARPCRSTSTWCRPTVARLSRSGAYYVVSEALTNAAKHARASVVKVGVEAEDANLHLSIRDDGIGGADSRKGSGLIGLIDRVEALGGTMTIPSLARRGTSLLVTIPIAID